MGKDRVWAEGCFNLWQPSILVLHGIHYALLGIFYLWSYSTSELSEASLEMNTKLLNESAILTTRYKKDNITKNEVNEAADRMIGGTSTRGIAGSTMEDTKNEKVIQEESQESSMNDDFMVMTKTTTSNPTCSSRGVPVMALQQ
mmetsp:Transcript_66/g.88  ORF Transcript_66/g.88 Transcript_66/m.88 type:complete len:144 (+) Transcript_66:506-937(+)